LVLKKVSNMETSFALVKATWFLHNLFVPGESGLFARPWQQENVISGDAFATLATERGWLGSGFACVKPAM
jgi:hypothetical protein